MGFNANNSFSYPKPSGNFAGSPQGGCYIVTNDANKNEDKTKDSQSGTIRRPHYSARHTPVFSLMFTTTYNNVSIFIYKDGMLIFSSEEPNVNIGSNIPIYLSNYEDGIYSIIVNDTNDTILEEEIELNNK